MAQAIAQELLDSNECILGINTSLEEALFKQYQLLNIIAEEATLDVNLGFSTLFARLSYISSSYEFYARDLFFMHLFRSKYERKIYSQNDLVDLTNLAKIVLNNLISTIWYNRSKHLFYPENYYKQYKDQRPVNQTFQPLIEALVVKIDTQSKTLTYLDDLHPGEELVALFDLADINDLFTKNILTIDRIYGLPVHVNFIDVSIDEHHIARPKAFIIQPDYLMDVTSIASYAHMSEHDIWLYALNKFNIKTTSTSLMVGNIANYFLDALVTNPELVLSETYQEIFKLFPLEWATYDDNEVNVIFKDLQIHFENLKLVVQQDFEEKGISIGQVYMEPSFYSRDYGIQGRLDLLHTSDSEAEIDIIELKSGKLFKPNNFGINDSHYTQTLLYDLLIQSAYQSKTKAKNYILYSKLESQSLKYAPRIKSQQYQIFKTRNDLVAIDMAMSKGPAMVERLIQYLSMDQYPDAKGFVRTNLLEFENIYKTSKPLEQAYFNHYVSFISKEMVLAKIGEHGVSKANGLAALWLETIAEKEDRFSVINYLELIKNNADQSDPTLLFGKTPYTAPLSNFRVGDIAVLYPHHANERLVLRHQIFKCSILEITESTVLVRMRSPQFNQQIFKTHDHWNIEEDVLTSSFNHMYRSLYAFLAQSEDKKDLLLGIRRPQNFQQTIDIEVDPDLTPEQKSIVYKAYNAKDYLLIWGPPGTGKTSKVLKNITKAYHKYTSEKIILLAYTNRAVDEICDALVEAGYKDEFIRIGSRYAVGEQYVSQLLDQKIADVRRREDITQLLHKHRIYVSTVASIMGKLELFDIIQIQTAIIDEASQILEPNLIGLLPRFDRFIMIGDHKQLPAVVCQNSENTQIKDEQLISIGITDMKVSLFERLYKQCRQNQWDNGWVILSQQGRMHQDIMDPVNHFFYEGRLKAIPSLKRLFKTYPFDTNPPEWKNRMLFINTDIDLDLNWKTNKYEADVCVKVVAYIHNMLTANGHKCHDNSIGIITPYRAQIALIKSKLGDTLDVMVDTVERYQGGAKDYILLSLCTNRLSQLASLVSLSAEGVDRKLNVALTRAKEQIIIIGNKDILCQNETYRAIIDYATEVEAPNP